MRLEVQMWMRIGAGAKPDRGRGRSKGRDRK